MYNNIGHVNPFRYRGYYFDVETDLYYLNSRYYDPELGRFINADDISYLDPESLNGLNLFAYCGNNPISYVDPDGNRKLRWWEKLLIGLTFIVLGALVTALTAGAGTGFFAAFGAALLTSTIQVGISTAISAGIGALVGGITTAINGGNFWSGALDGLISGAVDGFMWGGIFAGGAQIIGGLLPKTGGIKFGSTTKAGRGRVEMLYGTDKSKTLLSVNRLTGKSALRMDIGVFKIKGINFSGLHLHFGATKKLMDLHRFILPFLPVGGISGLISGLKN